MLYFIGLGLGDGRDISLRGLEIVKKCGFVYLESYTSILMITREELQEFYGREVIEMDREAVESGCEKMLHDALTNDVAFLVVGDAFSATTHSDLLLRARELGVQTKNIYNASIFTAVGASGLQLYKFGQSISQVFWTETWQPDSYYDKLKLNREQGLHTLCLLDIKVKEQSELNLLRGRKIYEPPRFMTCAEAAGQWLEIESRRKEQVVSEDTMCVGFARMGTDKERIVACTLKEMCHVDMGSPLHTLVVCGDLHVMEKEVLEIFSNKK